MNLRTSTLNELLSRAYQSEDALTTPAIQIELRRRLEDIQIKVGDCIHYFLEDEMSAEEGTQLLGAFLEHKTIKPSHLARFFSLFEEYDIETPDDLRQLLVHADALRTFREETEDALRDLHLFFQKTPEINL